MNFTKKNINPGKYKSKIRKALKKIDKENLLSRISKKDSTVWKKDNEYADIIKNRLGWLSLPVEMKKNCAEIYSFVDDARKEGFKYAAVLGMGGSSMCPEVCAETFGIKEGYLKLFVLDSTDPMTIFDLENSIDIDSTLFIVASKSGSTIEVDSFFRYFFEKVKAKSNTDAGRQFAAITDPGTQLEALAVQNNFRKIFSNPADIGGRYSALSYFGLVPAALIGVDIEKLLENAGVIMDQCYQPHAEKNPGALIGAFAGELSKKGRDKLTFVLSDKIKSFGYWVEQLIAESTGKEGKGILPVEGEQTGKADSYNKDRAFVCINFESDKRKKVIKEFEKNNFPFININLKDLYDIGGQFYLWEYATAVMGAVIGINPFDEPNVKESKDNTAEVLKYYETNKKLPEQTPQSAINDIKIYFDKNLFSKKIKSKKDINPAVKDFIRFFLKLISKGDYIAIMAYIQKSETNDKILRKMRETLRKNFKTATTIGYGPRFLHSTGQLHKGGADNGVFIQIVSDDTKDMEIPGRPYSFGILKQAQAIGDYQSLIKHKRRVIRINIGNNIERGLNELNDLIRKS